MSVSYFPWFGAQFFDANGMPLSGGKVYAYYDGSSTPAPTYNQNGVPNAFPIVLDSAGRCDLKGDDTITYKIVAYTSANSLVKTWVGISLASGGGGGATVTMDTILQGTAYKKITTSQYNSLVGGANTTLHYHTADRQWSNLQGKPTTFTPSAHATSHKAGGSDALAHNDLAPAGAGAGVAYGHISDSSQTIKGQKAFADSSRWQNDNSAVQIDPSVPAAVIHVDQSQTVGSITAGSSTYMYAGAILIKDGDSSEYQNINLTARGDQQIISAQTTGTNIGMYNQGAGTGILASELTSSCEGSGVIRLSNLGYAQRQSLSFQAENQSIRASINCDGGLDKASLYLTSSTKNFSILVDTTSIKIKDDDVGAAYQLPETVGGTYNIATREWVQTGYAYNHSQGSADVLWTITHGKTGYFPIIQCVDSSGAVVNGSIQHYSGYSTVTFAFATSGTARAV